MKKCIGLLLFAVVVLQSIPTLHAAKLKGETSVPKKTYKYDYE